MEPPEFPVAIGVFRAVQRPTYDGAAHAQLQRARDAEGPGDLSALLEEGDTWEVQGREQSGR
jgi:2-oxoglutarate ferredoxin oxidoreductase subunit beta